MPLAASLLLICAGLSIPPRRRDLGVAGAPVVRTVDSVVAGISFFCRVGRLVGLLVVDVLGVGFLVLDSNSDLEGWD